MFCKVTFVKSKKEKLIIKIKLRLSFQARF